MKRGKLKFKLCKDGTAVCEKLCKKKATKIKIPLTVKAKGRKYKVASIAAGAFKKAPRLKQVIISGNVRKIGKKAFYRCKKLRVVEIRSSKLKKLGSKSFAKCPSLLRFSCRTRGISAKVLARAGIG